MGGVAQPPRFQYIRDLGRGAFGSVVLAQDCATESLVAVKKLPRALAYDSNLERELLLHSSLRHPHIVRFQQVFLSPRHLNIVMEYVPDGCLLEHVQQHKLLPEQQARWLFQQLVLAVDYTHQLGICNRDIKLDNILLDKSDRGKPDAPILKMCDFGYARQSGTTSDASSRVGTLSYMSPEVLRNVSGCYSGRKADIWSCGVVLYAMLVGGMPFSAVSEQNLAKGILSLLADMTAQRYALPASLSPDARDLLQQLLQPHPAQRISVEGILHHPWFRVGLPEDALTMNTAYLGLPRGCLQSECDIWAIIHRARAAAAAADEVITNNAAVACEVLA